MHKKINMCEISESNYGINIIFIMLFLTFFIKFFK